MEEYRRFLIKTDDSKQIDLFEKLCKEKELDRYHLALILATIEFNPNVDTSQLLDQGVLQDL